jgi:arabinan endo-1,5-alpha-L-arabinosidase
MGKYVMYFCTTSSYVKSNICFATADDIEGPYHYEDTFLYSGYSYHDVKESNIEELMGTDPRPYTAASYDNNNWPNCIDPDVFYDEDGRMWMVYGSWSGGIFLIEIDEETGYPIYPEADEENHVDSYYGKKLLGGYHNSIEGPHIMYDETSGYYYLFLSYGNLQA